MARSPNCTGAPWFKGRVDVTITYPDPDETLLETPVALPTSEPASPQVSYTLGSQHMPVWSPYELEHVKTALLYAAGQNTSASAITVYYRIQKNGANVGTGSASCPAGAFYTACCYQLLDVQGGDTVSYKLWSGATGCNWDYKALSVLITRPAKGAGLVCDIGADVQIKPIMSLGKPSGASYSSRWQHEDADCADCYTATTRRALLAGTDRGLYRVGNGDITASHTMRTHGTCRPSYVNNYIPTRIAYTPLNLRV